MAPYSKIAIVSDASNIPQNAIEVIVAEAYVTYSLLEPRKAGLEPLRSGGRQATAAEPAGHAVSRFPARGSAVVEALPHRFEVWAPNLDHYLFGWVLKYSETVHRYIQ